MRKTTDIRHTGGDTTTKPRNIQACLVAFLLAPALWSCASDPRSLSDAERLTRLSADMEEMFEDQDVIDGPISLAEATARALKYNLDARVQRLEEAVNQGTVNTNRLDLLPELTAKAGYTARNNTRGSRSISLESRRQSLEPSTSEDKELRTVDLSLSWNMLDFTMAYARTAQAQEQLLVAREKKRKAVHNIVLDVRDAYWRTVSAQKNLTSIREAIKKIHVFLERAQTMKASRLETPRKSLNYQRTLLQDLQILTDIQNELELAPLSLAALINVRPGTNFRVLEEDEQPKSPPRIDVPLDRLEKTALLDRPELREEDHKARISQWEVKKTALSLVPAIKVEGGYDYTSNSFVTNANWWTLSGTLTKNIIDIFAYPWRYKAAKSTVQLANMRRLAMSMAVLAQVHISYKRYLLASEAYRLSQNMTDVVGELNRLTRNEVNARAADELKGARNEVEYILAALRQDLAYADLQNAYGRVLNSIGLDPLPDKIESLNVKELSKTVQDVLDNWQTVNAMRLNQQREGARVAPPVVPDSRKHLQWPPYAGS